MPYKNGNYCAFYVSEPFNQSTLGAYATKDFVYYNLIRSWKAKDPSFPFNDSHGKTYNVRDGSSWELTLKPRLRDRLRNSKNIVLFLSGATVNSRALREEIDYGINSLAFPVIVVYPDHNTKASILHNGYLKQGVKDLWNKLPVFRDSIMKVPTLHVPMSKDVIASALRDSDFMVNTKRAADVYIYRS